MKKIKCPCCGKKYNADSIRAIPRADGALLFGWPCKHVIKYHNTDNLIKVVENNGNKLNTRIKCMILGRIAGRRKIFKNSPLILKVVEVVKGDQSLLNSFTTAPSDFLSHIDPKYLNKADESMMFKIGDSLCRVRFSVYGNDEYAIDAYLAVNPEYKI